MAALFPSRWALLLAMLATAGAAPAGATTFTDPFSYAVGDLTSVSGGVWTQITSGGQMVNTSGVAGSPSGNPVVDAPNQIAGASVERGIGSVVDGATYVASLSVYAAGAGGDGGSAASLALFNGTSAIVQWGVDNCVITLDSGATQVIPGTGGTPALTGGWHTYKLVYHARVGLADTVDAYLDGAALPLAQGVVLPGDLSTTGANGFRIFARNRGGFTTLEYDDASWTIVPVPEPAPGAALALAALLLAAGIARPRR